MDSGEQQFTFFLDWFHGSTAVLVSAAILLALALTVFIRSFRWVWLTLLLYMATLGAYATTAWFDNTLSFPLQEIRNYNRPASTGLLLLLLIPTAMAHRGWRTRLLMAAVPAFFAFQVAMAVRLGFDGVMARAVLGFFIWAGTFVTVGFGLSRWLQSRRDVYVALGCVAAAGVLVVAGTIYQLALHPGAILLNNRLFGTTNNPNTLGYVSAITLPTFIVLLIRRQGPPWVRLVLMCAAGLTVVFILWTGSRAAAVCSIISVGLLFHRRLGRSVLVALGCGVVVLIGLQIWSNINFDRLVSTEDTRSEAWSAMWQTFVANPLFGQVGKRLTFQENLYLSVASRFGVVGMAVFLPGIVLFATSAIRLRRSAPALGPDAILADYVVGIVFAMIVGSLFDAHLAGQFSFSTMSLFVVMAVAAYFRDEAAVWGVGAAGPGGDAVERPAADAAGEWGAYGPEWVGAGDEPADAEWASA